ncbi:rod-binding protein [Arenibaculum pallidiluteum]|uniref:rod-binding protein n=1 Tax=Arenibaculum pallidiluteum TaxID=2812559 RepID=UPI001A963113|nr:rod-binding protein [Arenibaculum pallidiluteum]
MAAIQIAAPSLATLTPQGLQSRAAAAGVSAETWRATRKVAEDFEAQFLSQMMGHMFAGIETDGPFGGGHAEETFRSLLVDEYGKAAARGGTTGIADAVQRQLLRMQEA